MSVREAQASIDSAEFAEWIAFNSIDPFTMNRTEYMLAVVASILANRNLRKGAKPYKPADFIPEFTKVSDKRENPKVIETKLRAILHGNN